MAITQTQLDNLVSAYMLGARVVRDPEGGEITYRSAADMERAIANAAGALGVANPILPTTRNTQAYAEFSR